MDIRARLDCYHCGEPVDGDGALRQMAGVEQAFCCDGCATAAEWIAHADLGDYYRLRSSNGNRIAPELVDYSGWDRDSVMREHAREVDGGREVTVLTQGMHCAACAWLIDRALRREPGVLEASANAVTGRVIVRWDPTGTSLSRLMSRMDALGFRPWLASGEAREQELRRERRRWLMRVGIAGLGAMQAMMFADALYFDSRGEMAVATRDFFRWITFLVSTPVVFYSGWPFLRGMARELRAGRLGMDTLVAGSMLLAYGASLVETLRGGPQVWYDAAVMFVLLLLLARMLEQRARALASGQVDALARARPALATRESRDGGHQEVALSDLCVGDVVRVAPGESVPADGRVLDEAASFDEALLTGESAPVRRAPGETALAGSICADHGARIEVERVGSDTRVSELTRLVECAQSGRPRLAKLADQVAAVFVVALLCCAAAVFAWWQAHEPARALEVTLALLVISCPCALSLAIPAALAAANGRLARMGVLVLSPDALATLARVDRIVFDKTGTLTTAQRSILATDVAEGQDVSRLLAIAAALESGSRHPIATAFRSTLSAEGLERVRHVPGAGIEGWLEGRPWRIGRAGFAAGRADDDRIWLGDGARGWASFLVHEDCRTDAESAVRALRDVGVPAQVCSGDAADAVAAIACHLGDISFHARQSPEQKLSLVRGLQAEGRIVAMVGDGINDGPVLAGADVSLAMADGSALAQRAADIVVTGSSLQRIPEAIGLARRTRRVVRQNLAWAIGYNLLALPLAAAGMVTPWLAALGMAASSLLVTLNALRLTRGEH